jgi:hypothetical protein
LRIVQEDDVARANKPFELVGVGVQHPLIYRPLIIAESGAITG